MPGGNLRETTCECDNISFTNISCLRYVGFIFVWVLYLSCLQGVPKVDARKSMEDWYILQQALKVLLTCRLSIRSQCTNRPGVMPRELAASHPPLLLCSARSAGESSTWQALTLQQDGLALAFPHCRSAAQARRLCLAVNGRLR